MSVSTLFLVLSCVATSHAALLYNNRNISTAKMEESISQIFKNTRCRIVMSSDTVLKENVVISRFLGGHSPMVLLENVQVLTLAAKERCSDVVLRLGHDCCGFFRAFWRRTEFIGEGGVVVVFLEDNALRKNCLGCLEEISAAKSLQDLYVVKKGHLLRHFQSKESFGDKTLEVAAIRYPPFVIFDEDAEGSNRSDVHLDEEQVQKLDGTEFRLLQHLANKFDFRFRIVVRQEGELWGMVYENQSSSGALGLLKDGSIQIAIGGFNWDLRYSGSHVDQLLPYRRTLVKFLSPLRPPAANWLALVQPFPPDVWSAVGVAVAAAAVCLYFAHWLETGRRDLAVSFLVSLGVFAQQGDVPKFWSRGKRRAILVGLQMCVILLGACYSALLVAVLTLEQTEQQVDTVEQLADSDLRYTDVDDLWPGQLLLSDDPKIGEIMGRFEMSSSWGQLKARLSSKTFTYTAECLDSGFLCLQESLEPELLAKLHLSTDFVLASEIGMALAKGFPLRAAFDREVAHIKESGILSLWEQQVVANMPADLLKRSLKSNDLSLASHPVTLGLSHLGGPFLLLIAGLLLATLTFCLEIVCF